MQLTKRERKQMRQAAEHPDRCYCQNEDGHIRSPENFIRHIPSGQHYKEIGGDVYRCRICEKEWIDAPLMAGVASCS